MIEEQVREYYDQVSQHYNQQRFSRAYFLTTALSEVRYILRKIPAGVSVLEIGPGTGRFTLELVKRAALVTAIDVSAGMLEQVRTTVAAQNLVTRTLSVYDLESLSEYGNFDAVVCMRVLPHLEDPSLALRLIGRAIKPNGAIFFDLWNQNSFIGLYRKLLRRKSYVFTRYYSYSSMLKLISDSGLKINDALAWGYPRVGTLSLDRVGNKWFKPLGYSLTFDVKRQ